MTDFIGISLGDFTGIGPEVALKALASEMNDDEARYLLIGDPALTQALNQALGLHLVIQPYHSGIQGRGVFIHNPLTEPLSTALTPGCASSARAAYAYIKDGAEKCLRHEMAALVTAPVNKEAIARSGIPFVGQTEMLAELASTDRVAMMLLGHDEKGRWLRVALVTTHVPIKMVADRLTQSLVDQTITLAADACRRLGLSRNKVAVCGLNPHAGEGGLMGNEEISIITPAVKAAQKRGLDVVGPLSADSLFYYAYKGEFDAVVAMYHDQGLVPLKMIGFESGINWTLGLPFVRTSPDHGTAYDIAGKGKANPSSMLAAIQLAKKLAQ